MCQLGLATIVTAQRILMDQHGITSETALGLLVWAATDDGVTVQEVARTICETTPHKRDDALLSIRPLEGPADRMDARSHRYRTPQRAASAD